MDIQQILMVGIGLGFTAFGWFARELWTAVQKLREELNRLEVRIGTDFVRYDRLQDALTPIVATLERIEETLMTKADKP